ncbi:glucose-1-phosphate cytidylyltransferase [Magnetococcus sp. PR-3]|uniref:glucose-1-phosphate cytidylyltransferase n=1 Tax=Magnetococcus sp. PR-3 TaxID=3120355 RepID=UPI002FCE2671
MQLVILCGGLGTRLREETEFRPKPMVPIGGRPILWHIMKYYAHFGIKHFILALGYKGDIIKDYFLHYDLMNSNVTVALGKPGHYHVHDQHHDERDWTVTLVHTGDSARKGARLKRVERFVEGDQFMVTYGDGLSNVDLHALQKFHNSHGKMATVTGVNPIARFGKLEIEPDNRVSAFFEKPQGEGDLVNGGFFVFNRDFFKHLQDEENCDLEYGPLEALASQEELMVHRHHGFWACMDTLRDNDYLNGLWDRNEAPWRCW